MKAPRLRLMHADKVMLATAVIRVAVATAVIRVAVAIAMIEMIAVRAMIAMIETTVMTAVRVTIAMIVAFSEISTIKMAATGIAIADVVVDLVVFATRAMMAHKVKIATS